ncbi:MAG: 4,5-DOPA dioxygenase extradiol [Opitutaceae bacterium]|nr:4,5-DOPA dioxygenase extradiol [Cytophagales bacterium]
MQRSRFLKTLATLPLGALAMDLKAFTQKISSGKTERMPAVFIGHGNPMHALNDNTFTQTVSKIGDRFEKPKAVLVISAHWLTKGSYVADSPNPETIHDFGGFPDALFKVQYPAPGAPELAKQIIKNIQGTQLDHEWGLDHGAWTVLKHIYPKANIPVFQMSIDYTKPEAYHLELAKQLDFLRNQGVLVMGSGNIVHNLRLLNWQNPETTFDWAKEFDEKVKGHLESGNYNELTNYKSWGKFAQLAVPSNDHYLPMMYVLGLAQPKEELKFLYEGFEMGSISQRCFMIA